MAADCLYSKGHRNVMFLRDNETDYDRGSGYVLLFREALLERAKELGMTIHESSKHRDDRFDAAEFVRELRSLGERPTAIVNQANANVLKLVLQQLQASELRVPDDISVLSCGTYFEGELMPQPITEMPVMPQELCSKAVDLLVEAIDEHRDIKGLVELSTPVMHSRGSVTKVGDA